MIQAITTWAANGWHALQSRAVLLGIVGPRGLDHLSDMDPTHFLALCEGLLCESAENADRIQGLYDDAKPTPPVDRAAQLARFAALAQ